jgi:hypothetical protein
MTRTSKANWARGLLKAVRQSVNSLPSDEEIRLSVDAIDELLAFLQILRAHLTSQPTGERREDVERALVVLDSFLSSSRGPMMLTSPKSSRSPLSERDEDVRAMREDLERLGLDEIRERFQDGTIYTTSILRKLARELGLRLDSRLSHEDLADAVLKRGFANPRTYEGLRGGAGTSGARGASGRETRK